MGNIVDSSEVILQLGLSASITEEETAIVSTAIVRAENAVIRHLKYDPVRRARVEFYPVMEMGGQGRNAVWEVSDTHAYLRHEAGAAGDELQVRHVPIRSTPAIDLRVDYDGRFGTQAGSFAAGTVKTEGSDFWPNYDGVDDAGNSLCRDGIIRSMGQWPINPGSVKVSYTAGYTAAEFHAQDVQVNAGSIADVVVDEALVRAKKALTFWKKNATTGHLPGVITGEKLGDYSYTLAPGMANALFGRAADISSESAAMLQDFVNMGWTMVS